MRRKKELKIWIEGTLVAALAMALSFIPTSIGSSFAVSLGMIPLTLYALRRGTKAGVFAAFIWGLLHFPTAQVYYLTTSQVLLEYLFAFIFAGLAGLGAEPLKNALKKEQTGKAKVIIILATLFGTFMRYIWHFIAGVIFWGQFAAWGLSPVIFSLLMNSLSGLATALVTMISLLFILKIAPQLFLPKD